MKHRFHESIDNWNSYLPLLYKALIFTNESLIQVGEFGTGYGSTELMHDFCIENNRKLVSFESNPEYYNIFRKFNSESHTVNFVYDWDNIAHDLYSVVLIDHAPGERRVVDIEKLANKCHLMVIHDTETNGAGNYKYEKIWHLFKFIKHDESYPVRTTIVSNVIDVTRW